MPAKGPTFQVYAERREYPAMGFCIYCYRSRPEVELEEEHIIPEGLGGRMVLPDASCRSCGRETHAFEGHVAGRMLGDVRRHLGIRGKKRKRPQHPTVFVDRGHGEQAETVPLDAHPAVSFMPVFSPPGILFDLPKADALPSRLQIINFMDNFHQRVNAITGQVNLTRGFAVEPFARTLCKIGHAFAMAEIRGQFDPYLEGIIRGDRPFYLSHYVGCSITDDPPDEPTHTLHKIGLEFHDGYVLVRIRLFAIVGGPIYWAVVGRIKGL